MYVLGRGTLVLTIDTIPTNCILQYYSDNVNNSLQHVEFVISIIYNLIWSCWYPDGVDCKGKLMRYHRTH